MKLWSEKLYEDEVVAESTVTIGPASDVDPEPEIEKGDFARLQSELREGHLLDAQLESMKHRDKAWHDLISEIDRWTFRVQQLLYNGPTEFLTDFDGDWKPNALQSRGQISAGLQARLRELSEIVRKLKS